MRRASPIRTAGNLGRQKNPFQQNRRGIEGKLRTFPYSVSANGGSSCLDREQFDVLILGSGKGGKLLAWHMAQSGQRTAVVEGRWVGGSCPNIACLPSKNEIWSARVAHLARQGAHFGVITGPISTDMATVRQRKREMVNREIDLHLQNYKVTGAVLIMGTGR